VSFLCCVDTFSLNLDSDCEVIAFVFVYERHSFCLIFSSKSYGLCLNLVHDQVFSFSVFMFIYDFPC